MSDRVGVPPHPDDPQDDIPGDGGADSKESVPAILSEIESVHDEARPGQLALYASSLVHFRKRSSPEDWQAFNEVLMSTFKGKESQKKTEAETEEPPSKAQQRGQWILDATCVPSDIQNSGRKWRLV